MRLLGNFRSRSLALATFLATAMVLIAANRAAVSATMVERMSLDRVTAESARIVHATVLDVRSGRDERGLPATWITLSVVRTFKGPHAPQLTIKQYGVAEPLPDGTITRVTGLPRYHIGEEIVLFLRADSAHGFTSPVGFGQGVYPVSRDGAVARVRRDMEPRGQQDLEEFFSEVTRLAAPVP